jgi:hypothetical protein
LKEGLAALRFPPRALPATAIARTITVPALRAKAAATARPPGGGLN